MSEAHESHELNKLAASLSALRPRASTIDRDRLLFLAGQAAAVGPIAVAARGGWLWPLSTAAMLLVCLTLGGMLALRAPEERIVYVDRPAAEVKIAPSPEAAMPKSPAATPEAIPPVPPTPRPQTALAAVESAPRPSYLNLRNELLAHGVGTTRSRPQVELPLRPQTVGEYRGVINRMLGS